jgi:integrase
VINIAVTPSKQVQNFYKPKELAKLDAALVAMIADHPNQILSLTALRLLIATGARRSEILSLRWRAVDLDRAVLELERDKTSDNRRNILLTQAAVQALKQVPKTSSQFVFFSDSEYGHLRDIQRSWLAAITRAGVRRLRLHDLRHSFASIAIQRGASLFVTGKLLGHRQATTASRYAHIEEGTARSALERIADAIEGA